MELLIMSLISYLVGSINGSIISAKILNLSDPRKQGSSNPGATNMYRIHGKKPALMAFAIDYLKAFIIIHFSPDNAVIYSAAAVCLGHIFPIYHRFSGGKGVAVTAGIITAVSGKLMLMVSCVWIATYMITRISSIAATASVIFCLLSQFFLPNFSLILPCLAILISHKSNYARILAGNES